MITSRLRTLRDYIRWAVSRFHEHDLFFGHGADNAWDEARLLVLGAVHLPWEVADSYLDCMLEDDERVRLQHLLKRRIEERVPAAYLLGEAWFCGMSFIVDERVLVPRSPIGQLIEKNVLSRGWPASRRAFWTCARGRVASASSPLTCSPRPRWCWPTCRSRPLKWPTRTSSAMAWTGACIPCRAMALVVCRGSVST